MNKWIAAGALAVLVLSGSGAVGAETPYVDEYGNVIPEPFQGILNEYVLFQQGVPYDLTKYQVGNSVMFEIEQLRDTGDLENYVYYGLEDFDSDGINELVVGFAPVANPYDEDRIQNGFLPFFYSFLWKEIDGRTVLADYKAMERGNYLIREGGIIMDVTGSGEDGFYSIRVWDPAHRTELESLNGDWSGFDQANQYACDKYKPYDLSLVAFQKIDTGNAEANAQQTNWIGTWQAENGESLEVINVMEDGITVIYNGWTAEGSQMFHTTYQMSYEDAEHLQVREYSGDSWYYTLFLEGDHIRMTSRYPDRYFYKIESNAEIPSQQNDPFYGIWCVASKDESEAKAFAQEASSSGFDAQVFDTVDWSNLNPEHWWVVSLGTYPDEYSANAALPQVQAFYPDAYVKYSGFYRTR